MVHPWLAMFRGTVALCSADRWQGVSHGRLDSLRVGVIKAYFDVWCLIFPEDIKSFVTAHLDFNSLLWNLEMCRFGTGRYLSFLYILLLFRNNQFAFGVNLARLKLRDFGRSKKAFRLIGVIRKVIFNCQIFDIKVFIFVDRYVFISIYSSNDSKLKYTAEAFSQPGPKGSMIIY